MYKLAVIQALQLPRQAWLDPEVRDIDESASSFLRQARCNLAVVLQHEGCSIGNGEPFGISNSTGPN